MLDLFYGKSFFYKNQPKLFCEIFCFNNNIDKQMSHFANVIFMKTKYSQNHFSRVFGLQRVVENFVTLSPNNTQLKWNTKSNGVFLLETIIIVFRDFLLNFLYFFLKKYFSQSNGKSRVKHIIYCLHDMTWQNISKVIFLQQGR